MIAHALPKNDWGEVIMVTGYFYRIDFGPGVKTRHHFVHRGICNCQAGTHCKAVTLVEVYLKSGGKSAPNPPDGFYAFIPHRCPVCGAAVQPDPHRNSPVRGTGWQCLASKSHYWQSLGRKKQPACDCFVYTFSHEPGSGICKCGKEKTTAIPRELERDAADLIPA